MRPRKLDSSYLSNERLNPAVIRCNIEPSAGHLWYLLQCESWHCNQMKCLTRKMKIIQTLTPLRLPETLGQLLVSQQALQVLENAKFTSMKANTNNETRPRPQGKETQQFVPQTTTP